MKVGDIVTVAAFAEGQIVDVIGVSKGKGFHGVVRRFRVAGGPAAHGSMFHRRIGSIGMRQTPGRSWKNQRMPGHMGSEAKTMQNLRVVKIIADKNLLLVKGAVPGANGDDVIVRSAIKGQPKIPPEPKKAADMKLTVFSSDGTTSREQDFAGLPVFEGDKGVQAVKEVIVAIQANRRQGTRSTKTRGEVRGGGKKPWRQKGTGRARAGSIRSPLWGGGGVVFGPKPRDYSKKINSKVKALAFRRALFDRASAGEIAVIEAFSPNPAKTKVVNQVVGRIAPKGKVLLVDAPFTAETTRAARNLERVSLQEAAKLNTLDLSQYKLIIVSSKALEAIVARVQGGSN